MCSNYKPLTFKNLIILTDHAHCYWSTLHNTIKETSSFWCCFHLKLCQHEILCRTRLDSRFTEQQMKTTYAAVLFFFFFFFDFRLLKENMFLHSFGLTESFCNIIFLDQFSIGLRDWCSLQADPKNREAGAGTVVNLL